MIETPKQPEKETPENQELLDLEAKFFDVFTNFSVDKEKIIMLFEKLVQLYSHEGRHYHTLKHVRAMLDYLERYKDTLKRREAVMFATWYHDAIYDTTSKTNEEDSALLLEQDLASLGIPQELIDISCQLILDTKMHSPTIKDTDTYLFLDADLSILARPAHIYDIYSTNIRKEYSWVPEEEYRKGRLAVLQSFLKREKIYFSPGMEMYEEIARDNIKREIESLS